MCIKSFILHDNLLEIVLVDSEKKGFRYELNEFINRFESRIDKILIHKGDYETYTLNEIIFWLKHFNKFQIEVL